MEIICKARRHLTKPFDVSNVEYKKDLNLKIFNMERELAGLPPVDREGMLKIMKNKRKVVR